MNLASAIMPEASHIIVGYDFTEKTLTKSANNSIEQLGVKSDATFLRNKEKQICFQ